MWTQNDPTSRPNQLPTMEDRVKRRRGLLLAAVSVVGVSADGLLVKLSIRDGASPAATLIFKYASGAAGMAGILFSLMIVDRRFAKDEWSPFITRPTKLGWQYIAAGTLLMILIEVCYTLGFNYATSATVVAFASLAPIWTVLLSKPFLGLSVPLRTVVASGCCLAGSVVVGLGIGLDTSLNTSLSGQAEERRVVGLVCAIGTGLFLGAYITLVQSAAMRAPNAQMLYANTLAYVLLVFVGLALVPVLQDPGTAIAPEGRAILWLAINGFFCTSLSVATLTLAGALIPATEISLLTQIETVLGPLSTFIFLAEIPTTFTLAGGAVVVATVTTHELFAFREEALALRRQRGAELAPAAAPTVTMTSSTPSGKGSV